jgi:two-component system LytT family response regulator
MIIKCLTIDDEPYALQQLSDYVVKTPFLELAGKSSNAFEAMELMAKMEIDLIFVDINMPEMSGLEFVKTLPAGSNVIFTTAYSKYAVDSYKVNAIDYLLKPIAYEDFLKAANKAQKHILQNHLELEKPHDSIENFFVKSEGQIIKINLADIEFIESMSEYVKIYINGQKPIISLMTLKSLETALPKDRFMRVHRSYIVNLEKITTIERNRIIFNKNIYVPVSEQYKDEFKIFVDNKFL